MKVLIDFNSLASSLCFRSRSPPTRLTSTSPTSVISLLSRSLRFRSTTSASVSLVLRAAAEVLTEEEAVVVALKELAEVAVAEEEEAALETVVLLPSRTLRAVSEVAETLTMAEDVALPKKVIDLKLKRVAIRDAEAELLVTKAASVLALKVELPTEVAKEMAAREVAEMLVTAPRDRKVEPTRLLMVSRELVLPVARVLAEAVLTVPRRLAVSRRNEQYED